MAKITTKKEYRKRRLRFQIAAGLMDFVWTVVLAAVVLLCVLLLVELYTWLKGDVPVTFGTFFDIVRRALRMNQ